MAEYCAWGRAGWSERGQRILEESEEGTGVGVDSTNLIKENWDPKD